MDKWTRQHVYEPIEKKIKALDWIDDFKKEMGNLDEWRPLGDCPMFGKLPTTYIFDCRKKNMKHCNINNTICRRLK